MINNDTKPVLTISPSNVILDSGEYETYTLSVTGGSGPYNVELYNITGSHQVGTVVHTGRRRQQHDNIPEQRGHVHLQWHGYAGNIRIRLCKQHDRCQPGARTSGNNGRRQPVRPWRVRDPYLIDTFRRHATLQVHLHRDQRQHDADLLRLHGHQQQLLRLLGNAAGPYYANVIATDSAFPTPVSVELGQPGQLRQ